MELLEILKQVPFPVLIAIILIVVITTVYYMYQYAKLKRLDGIRSDVYQLFLKAEHMYNSDAGKQKMKWVCSRARSLLPTWLSVIISDETLENIIQKWFTAIKDLLDDGTVNESATFGNVTDDNLE